MITLIYICYAPKDKGIAEKIYAELKQREIQCWISSKDIINGQSYAEGIIDAIEKSIAVVFIYSSNANTSPQIIRELEKAASLDKFIIPFKIDLEKPSKLIGYYLSSPYKLDATKGTFENNIDKLDKIIQNVYGQLPGYSGNHDNTAENVPTKPLLEKTNNIKSTSHNDVPENDYLAKNITYEIKDIPENIDASENLKQNEQYRRENNYNQDVLNLDNIPKESDSDFSDSTKNIYDNQFEETMLLDETIKEVKEKIQEEQQENQDITYDHQVSISSDNQVNTAKKSKSKILIGAGILGGIAVLSFILIFTISSLLPSNKTDKQSNNNKGLFSSNTDANMDSSNFTEEEIIDFAKTAILELARLKSTSEFYETYAYRGSEYDIIPIYEDVLFSLMQLDVVEFDEVSIIGKNKKPHGIEHLLKLNFVCYADYETTENNETVHRQGEALLYNNVVILETPNDGLKYLYMEGIFEEDLNERNENIESSYLEIAESGNVNTEDTIQSYLPDSAGESTVIDDDTIMSVKDIVRDNDHKVVAVFAELESGTSQGSGFFIKDGVIVTNYHVIDGGRSAKVFLSDETYVDVEGVIFADPHVDMAVLKLVNEVGIEPVTIGKVSDSDKGSIAVAIGSPLGLFNTVSTGIISNFWDADGVDLIQISIPITHGNSGGALFNESGKLIGITTSGMGEANLNFAISSSHIIPVYEQIKHLSFNQLRATPLSNAGNINNSSAYVPQQSNSSNQELLASKYRFVNSDRPLFNELTYISDLQKIYNLSTNEYYGKDNIEYDLTFAFEEIISYGSENYGNLFKYILHEDHIKEDIENYRFINQEVLDLYNTTGQYIIFTVDEIEIIGAGIKKDGSIDGVVVSALFSENSNPYVRSKFYFKASYDDFGDINGFLYMGQVTEK